MVAESSGREKDYTPLKPSKQQDLQVVNSGQGVSQIGVAKPDISSGPVYSKIPELTTQQAETLQREIHENEPTVPVLQGKVWTQIPSPTDPPVGPVTNAIDLGKQFRSITPQALTDFRYQQVTDLTTQISPSLSEVNDPSVANMGNTVFFTGNWYAARSVDGCQSFSFVSPFTTFASANGGFCCNQVVSYAPGQDMMVWGVAVLLRWRQQYDPNCSRGRQHCSSE